MLSRVLATTALTLIPLAASAQNTPSLWDLIDPENLLQRAVQTGIMALRTQVDLKYGAMDVNLALGQVSISDITLWPLFDWDENDDCGIAVDRLSIRSAPLNQPEFFRFKVQADGLSAPIACLPIGQRQMVQMAGLETLDLPRVTVDLEYDIAQAEALVRSYAQVDGVAAFDLTADMSYFWFDGRDDMENPEPVVYLRSAALSVENLGAFEALQPMLPQPFLDPAQAGTILEGMLSMGLMGANRDAAPEGTPPEDFALNDAQLAFVASVKAGWPAFLENPKTLVLETGYAPENDLYVDFASYQDFPALAFEDLQPQLSLAPAPARAALPVALVQQALSPEADAMDNEDLRDVGLALLSGTGAPRNIAAGQAILADLARSGDGAAALALSDALEQRDPSQSYAWALLAGADSRAGAAARLDRLEGVLGMARVLELQTAAMGDAPRGAEMFQSLSPLRDEAMTRLSGIGRVRSYPEAAFWAMLGAAAGDRESADILRQIDERMAMADPDGQAAWASAEAAMSETAMQTWLGEDLPARFGGN